jgi:hypothetical protein
VIIELPLKEAALTDAVGWTLKESGLCRADVCIPVRNRGELLHDGVVDATELARLLGRPILVDSDESVAALTSRISWSPRSTSSIVVGGSGLCCSITSTGSPRSG